MNSNNRPSPSSKTAFGQGAPLHSWRDIEMTISLSPFYWRLDFVREPYAIFVQIGPIYIMVGLP